MIFRQTVYINGEAQEPVEHTYTLTLSKFLKRLCDRGGVSGNVCYALKKHGSVVYAKQDQKVKLEIIAEESRGEKFTFTGQTQDLTGGGGVQEANDEAPSKGDEVHT